MQGLKFSPNLVYGLRGTGVLKLDPYLSKKLFLLAPVKAFKNCEEVLFFLLKALFVFKLITFVSCLFGYVEKRLHKKS